MRHCLKKNIIFVVVTGNGTDFLDKNNGFRRFHIFETNILTKG